MPIHTFFYHYPENLIFDEAASAFEGLQKKQFLTQGECGKIKKLIVIAHHLAIVKKRDGIYMLGRGRVTASGIYNELISSNVQLKKIAKIYIRS